MASARPLRAVHPHLTVVAPQRSPLKIWRRAVLGIGLVLTPTLWDAVRTKADGLIAEASLSSAAREAGLRISHGVAATGEMPELVARQSGLALTVDTNGDGTVALSVADEQGRSCSMTGTPESQVGVRWSKLRC